MADVITRFKLETTQYDSKLRDASKELSSFVGKAAKAGSEFGRFTQSSVDTAKALGNISPSATTAKEKVKELVGAFNDVARAYNALTVEQQQSDFGKALASSLGELSTKVKQAKQELSDLGQSVGNVGGGGMLSGLGDKLGGALAVFGGNLMTAAAGAVANLGTEMAGMVKQGVELARQSEGVRNAFERLGRGDLLDGLREATHGTVTDIELMKAAVKFDDFKLPVEELGTMLAFAQQKAKDTGQSVDYMVDSIVTGLGRKSLMILDNLGLSAAEIKERMKETGDMTKAVGAIIRDQMKQAGDYVETAADRAAQANVNLQNKMEELGRKFAPIEEASNQLWTSMKIGILDVVGGPLARMLNGLTEAGRMRNALNDMNGEHGSGNTEVGKQLKTLEVIKKGGGGSGYFDKRYRDQVGDYDKRIVDLQKQIDDANQSLKTNVGGVSASKGIREALNGLIAERDALKAMREEYVKGAAELMKSPSANALGTVAGDGGGKALSRGQKGKVGVSVYDKEVEGGLKGVKDMGVESVRTTESMKELQGELASFRRALSDATNGAEYRAAEQGIAQTQRKMGVQQAAVRMGVSTEEMLNIEDGAADAAEKLRQQIEADLKDHPIVVPVETGGAGKLPKLGEETMKAWENAASAVGSVGSALQSIEDPGAKVAGIIANAIATIAMTFAKSLEGTFTPWDWIAAAAAGTATMVSTIAAIKSATAGSYAGGGIVPGNSYSGDRLTANVNSGELILNRSQQDAVAAQLEWARQDIRGDGGTGGAGGSERPYVTGEAIWTGTNNYTKRSGRGEIVTMRTLQRLGLI